MLACGRSVQSGSPLEQEPTPFRTWRMSRHKDWGIFSRIYYLYSSISLVPVINNPIPPELKPPSA
ncbi:hypothetical protein E2D04_10225 [Salmonella enterica subsp. enterica serovar Takoradi]|nr:hypothetical protein [Salmonella enterica]EBQ9873727.1 hypothetical protein [Salmonella enterica subsp. enterica serovar Takoradi]EEJ1819196.1 hypothetical protein [Salmonella enterica subsp. enterica]EAR9715230.1 hypothetical protein [Salmonella enterica]EAT0693633.1 hypothetical protein [Salmonella enterica]